MKPYSTYQRLIAAILVVFVLGVQCVNALSNSHTQVTHRHGGGSDHASQAHADRSHDHYVVKLKAARPHAHPHKHDPGDHSHDMPLRLVLPVIQFSFVPIWHTEAALPMRSVVVHPLERPPKLPTASFQA